jgi:hypothetical protein
VPGALGLNNPAHDLPIFAMFNARVPSLVAMTTNPQNTLSPNTSNTRIILSFLVHYLQVVTLQRSIGKHKEKKTLHDTGQQNGMFLIAPSTITISL